MYEKKKFKWEAKQKSDRVKMFQQMNNHWKSDKFLTNNHKVHPNESREGRKLKLAEYNQKFRDQSVPKK